MRDPVMMSGRWHIKAFAALSIAVLCMALGWLVPEQGYFTVRVFGSEFGLARIKSLTFIVWAEERFRFPLDWLLLLVALASVAIAIAVTRKHFRERRASA